MILTITDVDYAPGDLAGQLPIVVELIRQLPGSDRPDYWLARAHQPIHWKDGDMEITHVIVASRLESTRIEPGATALAIGIAYVVDETLLDDAALDFGKCRYVAIGACSTTEDSR